MRRVIPSSPGPYDPADDLLADARPSTERPWVLLNMVTSVDGATAINGVSGGLGGPGDRVLFPIIRSLADVILVGAGTVRAENYRPPRVPGDRLAAARAERGQHRRPRLAIVSNSLRFDPDQAAFDDDLPPIIVTHAASDPDRRAALADRADLVVAGAAAVDLADALRQLGGLGAGVVLSEGGPSLNGALIAQGLVDEVCLSFSPLLAGGPAKRLAQSDTPPDGPVELRLDRVLEDDHALYLRYRAAR